MPETREKYLKNPPTKFEDIGQISNEEARRQVEDLREAIEYHNHLYYVKNEPQISDAAYDRLFRRLQELEEAFPQLQSDNSPTRRVGAPPLEELETVRHAAPMLSLNAALEQVEVERFDDFIRKQPGAAKVDYIVEPKFDGVSTELVYERGQFKYGATRGDGYNGEDISANLRTIRSIPLHLLDRRHAPPFLSVRGEVFIPKDAFQQMNKLRVERREPPFANPRNAAAGMLRRLESKVVAQWPLDIVFYDILMIEGQTFDSHWEELKQFNRWGLKTGDYLQRVTSREQLKKYYDRLAEQRDKLPYEIDGIVIKVNNLKLRDKLGVRHRSPRWALAWKFTPRREVTVLEDIVVQVGMTGMLTPVALLQPVDVGGVTVSRATLHNEGEVRRKDVRSGDRVRIERAGDVIPEVVERIKTPGQRRGKEFSMPARCPVCGTPTVREKAYWFCPAGLSCPPQLIGHVLHFASREALDIDGLGEKTVKQMVDMGKVKDLADLYELTVDDLLQLERFAEQSARKLRNAIQQKKRPRLDRFLYGLGIRYVGSRTARLLAQEFKSLGRLRRVSKEQLNSVPDIGETVAESVRNFFDQPRNQKVLQHFEEVGVEVQDMPTEPTRQPLQDKTFVFTGSLEKYSRSEAQERVEMLGGRASSSVSSNTDYVVAGESPGSKLNEARAAGVEILNEQQFDELCSQSSSS